MQDVISDMQKRLANLIRHGVICEVIPGELPRCRVRLGKVITAPLPYSQGSAGARRQDYTPFAVGDAVTVLSESGDLNNGRVVPGFNITAHTAPYEQDDMHVIRYGNGSTVTYSESTNEMRITMASGGKLFITADETEIDSKVTIKQTLTVEGETQLQANAAVMGDMAVSGQVSDSKGTLDLVREIYNAHNHPGDSGGTTDKPNQPM